MKNKIKCVVSGFETSCRPEILEARIQKYGDEVTLRANYICNAAKAALRAGKSVEDIRKEAQLAGADVTGLTDVPAAILEKYAPKAKKAVKTA